MKTRSLCKNCKELIQWYPQGWYHLNLNKQCRPKIAEPSAIQWEEEGDDGINGIVY